MANNEVSYYREVNEKHQFQSLWKEITISTGGSLTNQKDVKFLNFAGGYAYRESDCFLSHTRNRFIYWRTCDNIVELTEVSLDFNLRGQNLRICFSDASVVSGVSIFETDATVVVLVCTMASVHRFNFHHLSTLHVREILELGTETVIPSIFADVSSQMMQNPTNIHNINLDGSHTVYQVHAGCGHLTSDGEAVFALAVQNGSILVVRMPPFGSSGSPMQHEIKQSGVMSRLLGGFVPSLIRGPDANTAVTSIALHQDFDNLIIFAACKDHKLRTWSVLNYEFLGAVDLLEHVPDSVEHANKNIGGAGHIIRTFRTDSDGSLCIAVFLSFAIRSQFVIYNLKFGTGKFNPVHVTTLFGIEGNLVDFFVTSGRIWTLWLLRTGESSVQYTDIIFRTESKKELKRRVWTEVPSGSEEKLELDINQPFDPREVYLKRIFHLGRFSTPVILKAIKIYRRSTEVTRFGETFSSIPLKILKSEVCQAVETEILQLVGDQEMTEEDYVQLQLQQWSRFYSCCVQYHERGMKPLGIFSDEATGLVGIVKKSAIGFLYPCPVVDQIYLSGVAPNDNELNRDHPGLESDNEDVDDLVVIGRCLKMIRDSVEEETGVAFENGLLNCGDPHKLIADAVAVLQDVTREDVVRSLEMELNRLDHILQPIERFTDLLDITLFRYDNDDAMIDQRNVLGNVFSSATGIGILAEVFRQTVATRFEVARDLLILIKLLPHVINRGHLPFQGKKLKDLEYQLGFLVRCYHLLKWCSESLAIQEATSSLESSRKQLEKFHFLKHSNNVASISKRLGDQHLTLLEVFLNSDGGGKVREQLENIIQPEQDVCAFWRQALLPMVSMTARLIWPTVAGFVFPQSLIGHSQHLAIQGYVRLLRDWCDFDASSRQFVLGQSYLNCNEPYKALDCFLSAAKDVTMEEFLISFMSHASADPKYIEVQYYLQVMNLFEEFDYPHLVVELAKLGTNIADPEDPNLPTLWSKIFKNELEMGHNNEAYNAMMDNPDLARRNDCLRQFLVVLCERNELSTLVDLSYQDTEINLEPEVVKILESRALSADLTKQNFYDLLYAFHVKRNNYKRAGSIMYDYGVRVRREIPGLKGLQRQAKCYLACMNALKLGDPKFRWIVKPVASVGNTSGVEPGDEGTASPPKRPRKEDDLEELLALKKRRVEVLGLAEIEKEYAIIHAHLMLLQKASHTSLLAQPSLRPDETVGLLTNAGMFDLAFDLCQLFNLSMTSVFEGVTLRCIWLSKGTTSLSSPVENQYLADAWIWLQYNEQFSGTVAKEAGRAPDCAWRLLQLYLEKFEEKSGRYHKCVAATALQQGFELPTWFLVSYKKMNAAELLHLYLEHGFLEDATELVIEYIQATMGKGKEYFGLDDYLHAGASHVWLPYTSIDLLLQALNDFKDKDQRFSALYSQLSATLKEYFQLLKDTTEDTLVMLQNN